MQRLFWGIFYCILKKIIEFSKNPLFIRKLIAYNLKLSISVFENKDMQN